MTQFAVSLMALKVLEARQRPNITWTRLFASAFSEANLFHSATPVAIIHYCKLIENNIAGAVGSDTASRRKDSPTSLKNSFTKEEYLRITCIKAMSIRKPATERTPSLHQWNSWARGIGMAVRPPLNKYRPIPSSNRIAATHLVYSWPVLYQLSEFLKPNLHGAKHWKASATRLLEVIGRCTRGKQRIPPAHIEKSEVTHFW